MEKLTKGRKIKLRLKKNFGIQVLMFCKFFTTVYAGNISKLGIKANRFERVGLFLRAKMIKNNENNKKLEIKFLNPLLHNVIQRTFDLNLNSEIRRDHGKNFL